MDKLKILENPIWAKTEWSMPPVSKEANDLLAECAKLPLPVIGDDIEQIIKKSQEFPIKFPIDSIRLGKLGSSGDPVVFDADS